MFGINLGFLLWDDLSSSKNEFLDLFIVVLRKKFFAWNQMFVYSSTFFFKLQSTVQQRRQNRGDPTLPKSQGPGSVGSVRMVIIIQEIFFKKSGYYMHGNRCLWRFLARGIHSVLECAKKRTKKLGGKMHFFFTWFLREINCLFTKCENLREIKCNFQSTVQHSVGCC